MLASLLGQAPSETMIGHPAEPAMGRGDPREARPGAGRTPQAARLSTPSAIEAEFNRLFVGMGCGEMVPYASWYRERKIQSSPLASLQRRT